MNRTRMQLLALALIAAAASSAWHQLTVSAASRIKLQRTRHSAGDLEVGGELAGVPPGETRFIAYSDLLKLPLETYTVTDDSNFIGTVRITGVALEKLPSLLGAAQDAHMITAVCDDLYAAHYPAAYIQAHHPLLVLRIDGRDPAHWPLGADHSAMGPYLISHAKFTPGFQILAHKEEPQVPWGVIRLDFNHEADVYAPIQPRGPAADSEQVQQGFAIAKQNCFRCHARDGEGGRKSKRSWERIARQSVTDPRSFDDYVRNPQALNPASQMAASPQYDAATLAALRSYFRPFAETRP
ncbi:MAG: hypothetical protein V4555_09510 [Acidobacteriota bacterium]